MDSSESLILKATVTGSSLFQLSQSVVVYRASVAYLLQHIQLFLRAIQPLKNKKLSDQEVGGLKMFQEILDSFQKLLPNLDKKWVNTILSWPSTKFHVYVHKLREKLRVACAQLSLDTKTVIPYSKAQDDVNKLDDLQNLRRYLQDLSQSAIARPNSIDIQQIIETRLRSISEIIGTSKTNSSTQPSSDNSRFIQLKDTIDKEFSLFNSIDIPNSDLEVGKVLGSGGFGTVYKGYRKSTGELLAIKEVRADKLSMSTWSSLYSEVATMLPLRHRYVLELVGVHIKEPYRIITRFCPGYSLFDRLHCRSKSKKFTPEKLTALAYQVAVGMEFLHSKDVVHRDLKTMNILLDDEDVAIIADFGLAGIVTDKGLMGGVGTPHYTAPEVLERRSYGSKIDSYSYGIILWEMATGKIPYDGLSPKEIYNQVVNKNYRLPLSERIPKCLKNLISRCWSSSPNERPDFTEIVSLFKSGKVYFSEKQTKEIQFNSPESYPPIDLNYTMKILKDPNSKHFESVIKFLSLNMSKKVQEKLQQNEIIKIYNNEMKNLDSILLLASLLLKSEEFDGFLQNIGISMIRKIISEYKSDKFKSIIQLFIKAPENVLKYVDEFIPIFAEKINEFDLGPSLICLLSRLFKETILKYKENLISFFISEKIFLINTDEKMNSFLKILLEIKSYIPNDKLKNLILFVEKTNLIIPIEIINFLVENVKPENYVDLVLAIVKACSKTEIVEPLIELLQKCSKENISELAKNFEMFDNIHYLLSHKRLIKPCLYLLFELSKVPIVPMILANHPMLQSLLQIKEYKKQKLQIFTSLFLSEQFCYDTTIGDGVLNLVLSSMEDPDTVNYSIKLIGALSSHQYGCEIIQKTQIHSLVSQMFLSSIMTDVSTSLTILSNISQSTIQIPQISLIISCLMQDLNTTTIDKCEYLSTLINLVRSSPESVQEQDLCTSILPLLSVRQPPKLILLALRLCQACDHSLFRIFHIHVQQLLFNILNQEELLYPEIIEAVSSLIASIIVAHDMKEFVERTNLIQFLKNECKSIEGVYPEIAEAIKRNIYTIEVPSSLFSPSTLSHLAFANEKS